MLRGNIDSFSYRWKHLVFRMARHILENRINKEKTA